MPVMETTGRMIAVLGLCLLATGTARPAAAQQKDCALHETQLFDRVAPKVVEVAAIAIDPFRVSGRITAGTGSGFVIENGLVATNYHVIADAQTAVIFADNGIHDVEIIGIDPASDIAVLRPVPPLTPSVSPPLGSRQRGEVSPGTPGALPFAPEDSVRIGQKALVVGSPLGLGKSLSVGIISGKSRVLPISTTSWQAPYLQTDAAVSHGNSGGPLLDACGRVAGMISANISREGTENLGFAIPVEVLKPVLRELIDNGAVSRPWHGLYGQIVTPPILMMMGVPENEWDDHQGFLVETVEPGSAADKAGLHGGTWPVMWGPNEILLGGDIILQVNGVRITTQEQAMDIVRELEVGDSVRLLYLRDGLRRFASVTLPERPILEAEKAVYRMRR